MGNETVDGSLQCGRGDQMRLVAVAPGMQNLQGDFAAFLMHRFSNGAMVRDLADVIEHCAAFHPYTCEIWRNAAADNQRHAVTGAFSIKRRQPFSAVRVFFQPGVH